MASSVRFRCHGCRARIKAPAQLVGKERACPACGRRLLVRPEFPEDSGPLLLHDHVPRLVWRRAPAAVGGRGR
jgi:hypothetical protein